MRILIADDDPLARRLLEASLVRWGYEVVATANGVEALAVLTGPNHPEIAVLDWMMPEMDGLEVCREIRKRRIEPYIYTLLLTAKEGKQALVDGIEAGADDFVAKPFDPNEVRARLRAGQRIVELQHELFQTQQRLQYQATHDALTGLWNRPAVREALDRELNRSRRESSSIAVVLADIDHFKKINDSIGHHAGDEVLKVVAERMRKTLRPYDGLGRYGGEEFLMFAPNCDAAGAAAFVERVRLGVARDPVSLVDQNVPVTLSLGAAVIATQKMPMDELVAIADQALYRAKAAGRNRAEIQTVN